MKWRQRSQPWERSRRASSQVAAVDSAEFGTCRAQPPCSREGPGRPRRPAGATPYVQSTTDQTLRRPHFRRGGEGLPSSGRTMRTFRAPYAGEFLRAALPGSMVHYTVWPPRGKIAPRLRARADPSRGQPLAPRFCKMPLSRRPKIDKLVRKRDSRRLVAALGYHDYVMDREDRVYDLGTNVRRDAALALATAPDDEGVDVGAALIGALDDASGTVRAAAAASVAARGEQRALPSLAEASLTWRAPRHKAARSAAIEALVVLGGPDAVEVLVETALRPDTDVAPGDVADTLVAIVDHGGEGTSHGAREAALAALIGQNGAVPERAAQILVWLGPGSVDALHSALSVEQARLPAIAALGRLRDIHSSEALVGYLMDEDPHVRQAAASALGEIADPRVASSLAAATSDGDPDVRESALAALRKLAPTGAAAAPVSDEITAWTTPD